MTYSRKLIVPTLLALGLFAFLPAQADEGKNGDVPVVAQPTGGNNDGGKNGDDKNGGGMNNGHGSGIPSGGDNDGGKNGDGKNGEGNPPPGPAPQPDPGPKPMKLSDGDQNNDGYRRIACYNGYQVIFVRHIGQCGLNLPRRATVQRPVRYKAYVGGGYNYGGGYATGGGYNYGGGYATGGGYVYGQPIIRYYKPASRAAVMQAEKRARRAAQYSYGAGYGYTDGGYAGGYAYGGGYAYDGGYAGGYGYDSGGYGEPAVRGPRYRIKKHGRRHHAAAGQGYGIVGGGYDYGTVGGGYSYDAGYGPGFGYGGAVVHYGPVMTKDGGY